MEAPSAGLRPRHPPPPATPPPSCPTQCGVATRQAGRTFVPSPAHPRKARGCAPARAGTRMQDIATAAVLGYAGSPRQRPTKPPREPPWEHGSVGKQPDSSNATDPACSCDAKSAAAVPISNHVKSAFSPRSIAHSASCPSRPPTHPPSARAARHKRARAPQCESLQVVVGGRCAHREGFSITPGGTSHLLCGGSANVLLRLELKTQSSSLGVPRWTRLGRFLVAHTVHVCAEQAVRSTVVRFGERL